MVISRAMLTKKSFLLKSDVGNFNKATNHNQLAGKCPSIINNMIKLLSYQVNPFLLLGESTEPYLKPNAEWIRDIVNQLMVRHRGHLVKAGVDTSIFHNHDEARSHTLPPYPRILYQNNNGIFLVTGINQGADALAELLGFYREPVYAGKKMMVSFSPYSNRETDIVKTDGMITYSIGNYLALDMKTHKQYINATAVQKILLLENTLIKHLLNDLFHYLEVDVDELTVEILEMPAKEQRSMTYKNHHYLAFNLIFAANVLLPDFVALGNGKAFGYGIIKRLK